MSKVNITITAILINDSDKAILIDYEGERIWLPKSQVEYWLAKGRHDLPPKIGDEIDVEIPEWLASEKDISE